MIIADGAVLMHILKLAVSETFDDYTIMCLEHVKIPSVDSAGHIDTGCDATTWKCKILLANWPEFLQDNNNTCFYLFSERVTAETFPAKVVQTNGEDVLFLRSN